MTPALRMENVSAGYQSTLGLKAASVEVAAGTLHAIVGPNGSGKSTLLKAALGLLPGSTGSTQFFGKPLSQARAKVAYMPQVAGVDWDFPIKVRDVVLMGTFPKLGWLKRPSASQRDIAAQCLERVGLSDVAERHISQLSGGQKQRVFVARLLAQQADLLLMDEPFAGVDIASESVIAGILKEEKNRGKTVIIVHHDLSNVADLCDHATLLSEGDVVASGPVTEVITPERLAAVYGIDSRLVRLGA